MADSSITTSLAVLDRMARQRAEERERTERRHDQRKRIASLKAHQRRRHMAEARAKRARLERFEAQREAAKRAGIREGAMLSARIEAEHAQRQRALDASRELERLASVRPQTRRRPPVFAVLLSGLLAAGISFAALQPRSATASSWLTPSASAQVAMAVSHAELSSHQLELEALEEDLALATTPPAESLQPATPVRTRTATRTPRRAPSPTPAPTPAPTCDDGIGDPCCAFGEIVC
jgi:hypothetical protein